MFNTKDKEQVRFCHFISPVGQLISYLSRKDT